jgi:micrococcal nuclease
VLKVLSPLLAASLLFGAVAPSLAARCSGGADCRACSNCSGCAHCGKRGGACSVCRPDLYQSTSSGSINRSGRTNMHQNAPIRTRQTVPRKQRQSKRFVQVPTQFSGKVAGVSDGDTLTVLYGQMPVRIRLYGVDAPEKAQAFGQQSRNFTSQSTFGKTATIYSKGNDRYGRVLRRVFIGKTCINTELVRNGMAWWYRQYSPKEAKLRDLEVQARARRVGLWRDAQPVAPWDFRRARR